jgi:hypothetical protein
MGGQPWPELELRGRPWGTHRRGERGGREEERGGGVPWGGAAMEDGCSSIYAAHARLVHSVRERRQEGGRRKEKKKKKKKKKKKRNKRKNMENFPNLKFSKK